MSASPNILGVELIDPNSGLPYVASGSGTQYSDGTTQTTPTGTVAVAKNPSNILHPLGLDSSGNLLVNVAAGGTGGNASVSTTGTAAPASATFMGASDGANLQPLLLESLTNKNLRTAVYNGANEMAVSAGGAAKVDGSAVTQPVSAASLPLPTGAASAAKQPALGTAGAASADVLSVQGIASMTALKTDGSATTQPVSAASLPLPTGAAADTSVNGLLVAQASTTAGEKGPLAQGATTTGAPTYTTATTNPISLTTAGALRTDGSGVTQPVSAASLPLPAGASTAAKQPALGTAGTASADVLSVQGIASMTALKTDGSGVTQPISGAVTANIGTAGSLALDTSVNGLLLSQASTTSGQKGSLHQGAVTTAAPTYVTGNTNPLSLTTAGALRIDGSAVTQPVSVAALPLPSGAAADTSVNGLLVAQASTTAGEKGPLAQAAVTTAAPTYVTGNTNPLSMTTAGLLRVDASGTTVGVNHTQINGAAVATAASGIAKVGLTDGTGTAITSTGAAIDVNIKSGAAAGGTSLTDKGAFTTGTTNDTPVAGLYQTTPDTITTGTAAAIGIDANRNVRMVGNVASLATDSGSPVKVGAVFNTTAPAPTNGQRVDLQADASGNLKVLANVAAATDNAIIRQTLATGTTTLYSTFNGATPGAGAAATFLGLGESSVDVALDTTAGTFTSGSSLSFFAQTDISGFWYPFYMERVDVGLHTWALQATGPGQQLWRAETRGVYAIKVVMTVSGSDSVPVTIRASFGAGSRQGVNLLGLLAGEDIINNKQVVEQRYTYLGRIVATGTAFVKASPGYVDYISINNLCTASGGTTGFTTLTVYDNIAASGQVVAIYSLPNGAQAAVAQPFSIPVHCQFATGITMALTLGASVTWTTPDITVFGR